MKRIILLTTIIVFVSIQVSLSQSCGSNITVPQLETKNGVTYWNGRPMKDVVNMTDLIFEGRVLSDSSFFQNTISFICTYHRVLVLKQFKGVFKSDTIIAINGGGRTLINNSWEGKKSDINKEDEGIFFVSTKFNSSYKIPDANIYFVLRSGLGFTKICDKKDVVKEVYEPIEAVTGQKYVDIHPNTCATQQKK